jgi:hypothetical protein
MAIAGENEISMPRPSPEAMMRIPLGAASPLWLLFAGAAMSGAAWWWMSQWTRPANLEAMFGRAQRLGAEVETEVEAQAARVTDAVAETPAVLQAAVLETEAVARKAMAAPAALMEATVEAAAPIEAPVLERLEEAADIMPVGGEAAPISPVLEAVAPKTPKVEAPKAEAAAILKTRKRSVEPKAS